MKQCRQNNVQSPLYFPLTSTLFLSEMFSVHSFNDQKPAQQPKKHGLISTAFSKRHRSLCAPEVAGAQEDLVSCNWIAFQAAFFSVVKGLRISSRACVFFFSHSDYVTMINN